MQNQQQYPHQHQQRRSNAGDSLTDLLHAALSRPTPSGGREGDRRGSREALLSTTTSAAVGGANGATLTSRNHSSSSSMAEDTRDVHVVDITDPTNATLQLAPPPPPAHHHHNDAAASPSAQPASNHAHDNQSIAQQLQHLFSSMQGVLPFVAIASSKLFFDHRVGVLLFIGLHGTFYHANRALLRNITESRTRTTSHADTSTTSTSSSALTSYLQPAYNFCGLFRRDNFVFCNAWIVGFLMLNIAVLYVLFADQRLYLCLIMQRPILYDEYNHIDFWTLMWIVGITDYVIRYMAIILKTLVAWLPSKILHVKQKGRHYMLIERLSQFYRGLTPVVPWLSYLYDVRSSANTWFSVPAIAAYLVFKVILTLSNIKEMRKIVKCFKNNNGYGVRPASSELENIDKSCPICKDIMLDPLKLPCAHIFCDVCISQWFDCEKTCPLCRQAIIEQPLWRDGSTQEMPVLC